jgi:hypothetical protein
MAAFHELAGKTRLEGSQGHGAGHNGLRRKVVYTHLVFWLENHNPKRRGNPTAANGGCV